MIRVITVFNVAFYSICSVGSAWSGRYALALAYLGGAAGWFLAWTYASERIIPRGKE